MQLDEIVFLIEKNMKQQGFTVYRLAKRADVPQTTVHRVLNGENIPSIDVIIKLLDALELKLMVEYKS